MRRRIALAASLVRGGFHLLQDDDRSVGDLFGDMSDVRDSDQFLVKVRYRL